MNKTELSTAVAERAGLSRGDAQKAVDAVFELVGETLAKGDKVAIVGFGTFYVSERAERMGRNPQTKQPMTIPASKAPSFKPGKPLRDQMNGGNAPDDDGE